MKSKAVLHAAMILALAFALPSAFPSAASAAEASTSAQAGTSIDAVATARAGDTVTISGTTNAAEVIVKVLNPDQTVLFFDIVKSSDGRFRDSFALPASATAGTYAIAAGQGADTASGTFSVTSGGGGTSVPTNPGGGIGTNPADPATVQVKFALSDIPPAVNGIATLDASKSGGAKLEVQFPAAAGQSLGGNSLRILLPGGAITLPKDVLAALSVLAGTDAEASVSLHVTTLADSEALAALAQAGAAGAGLAPQGSVYELTLGVVLKDGTTKKLETFPAPVWLQFQLAANTNDRLAGIYYLADGGAIDYIGGALKDRTLTAEINHFSKYGVFTYAKSYADVPSTHWAADVIQELTAKHIVQGVSNDRFAPRANVTRAEFAAMLVRALGLNPTAASPFGDVPAGSWYAGAVAAAYENGIVSGTDKAKFEPSRPISRQEMAVMIVRVYAKQSETPNESGSASDLAGFKDAGKISSWAKADVQTAVHAGLMQGSSSLFTPLANTTRAEAAKVLVNLLFGA